MDKVYVVTFTTGDYDDVCTSIDGVYSSKEDAYNYVNKVLNVCRDKFRVHIDEERNVFIIYSSYELEDDLNDILEKTCNKAYMHDGIIAFEIVEHKVL